MDWHFYFYNNANAASSKKDSGCPQTILCGETEKHRSETRRQNNPRSCCCLKRRRWPPCHGISWCHHAQRIGEVNHEHCRKVPLFSAWSTLTFPNNTQKRVYRFTTISIAAWLDVEDGDKMNQNQSTSMDCHHHSTCSSSSTGKTSIIGGNDQPEGDSATLITSRLDIDTTTVVTTETVSAASSE